MIKRFVFLFVAIVLASLVTPAVAQKVVLQWVAPVAPACGPITAYNVYRSKTSGGEVIVTATNPGTKIGSVAQVGTAPVPTTYTDTTVGYGETDFYKVTAWAQCNTGHQESAFSNESVAVIPSQVIIVNPPTALGNSIVIP